MELPESKEVNCSRVFFYLETFSKSLYNASKFWDGTELHNKNTIEFWDTEMQMFLATALERFFLKVYVVVDLSETSYHIIVLEHSVWI